MVVIAATFRIKPDRIVDFKELIAKQAQSSVTDEMGCLQFDVCQDENDPATFLLYEVYADAVAFDEEHVKIRRFREFAVQAEEMNAQEPEIKRMARLFANRK